MDPSQFPAGQPLTLAAVLLLGFGGVITVIKFGLGRVADSFKEMASAFKAMADKHESNERSLVRLETIVQEGRSDIGEIKTVILNVLSNLKAQSDDGRVTEPASPASRRTARLKTPVHGVPRRASTNSDQ